jgi:hypothetical protein
MKVWEDGNPTVTVEGSSFLDESVEISFVRMSTC